MTAPRITPDTPVLAVMESLNTSARKVAVVLDESGRVAGLVSDGDLRRALLKHGTLELVARQVMNASPLLGREEDSPQSLLAQMRARNISQIPIVDADGVFQRIVELRDLLGWAHGHPNSVVLMAGGFGKRLHPLTQNTPKPLINVGGRPILETILLQFRHHGFTRFYISIHYLGEQIEDYFGDGSQLGVQISYLREDTPLGTAGCLSLLPARPSEPFFVMNGDLLTDVDMERLLRFHQESRSLLTVGALRYEYEVPYGVIEIEDGRMKRIVEKPKRVELVSGGVYIVSPKALDLIEPGAYTDMPTLLERAVAAGERPTVYPITESWYDIGRPHDLSRAESSYGDIFGPRSRLQLT